jgi:nitroreductase
VPYIVPLVALDYRRSGGFEMDILTAIHSRRAVREYLDEPVADDVIAALIDAAIWAPSGMNLQPWCFFVIDDPVKLAAWSAKAKAQMLTTSADHPELLALAARLQSPSFNIFYGAPLLILICATADEDMAIKDCCLAAENLMLAATGLGLGSCWIGLSEAWLSTEEARTELAMPPNFTAVAPIIIGHPRHSPPPPARRGADIRRP